MTDQQQIWLHHMFERTDWHNFMDAAMAINAWADLVFPGRVPEASLAKLAMEELPELLVHRKQKGIDGIGTELADCFILLADLAIIWGVNLPTAICAKMKINAERRWEKDEDTGFYNHLEDGNAESPVEGSSATAEGLRHEEMDHSSGNAGTDCGGTPLSSLGPGVILVRLPDGWHTSQLIREGNRGVLGACSRCRRNLDGRPAEPNKSPAQRTLAGYTEETEGTGVG